MTIEFECLDNLVHETTPEDLMALWESVVDFMLKKIREIVLPSTKKIMA